MVAAAVAGAAIVGGVMSSDAQRSAANTAADAQERSANMGIAEQRDEFAKVRELLAPYTLAGKGSLTGQQDLLGLNGNDAQSAAIAALQKSPEFAALTKNGEDAILANASATGGLRGGNVQAALAQFRPQVLSSLINDRFAKLGGLTSLGENAAAMTGNAGMSTGNAITDLLQQGGAAQAGAILAGGRATANNYNNLASTLGSLYASGKLNFGGSSGGANTWANTPSQEIF